MSRFPTEIVPKKLVKLAEMPVTRSNKIDRKSLAENGSTERSQSVSISGKAPSG